VASAEGPGVAGVAGCVGAWARGRPVRVGVAPAGDRPCAGIRSR